MNPNTTWKNYLTAMAAAVIILTAVAAFSGIWVMSAVAIGLLFGFFMQKGDLCGTSAFSEIIMMHDRRKVFGLWILIVVAMLGFALMDILGWVKLSPKPFLYLNYIVGGLIFGAGTVLAGGCISGCMFKAASGNLNSIVALIAIPVGVMAVEFGPLQSLNDVLKKYIVKAADGSPLTLPKLLGLPFGAVTLAIGITTLIVVFIFVSRKRKGSPPAPGNRDLPYYMTHSWKPWVAGIAIGLLMIPAYLSSAASGRNYPLGVTHGVMQSGLLLVERNTEFVWRNAPVTAESTPVATPGDTSPVKPPAKKISLWLVLLVAGYLPGAWTAARMSGQVRLLPKPPDEIMFALLGGLLTGIGAALAGGCVVGNIMSGWALLSVGMFVFGIATIAGNWLMTYFYMMGGQR